MIYCRVLLVVRLYRRNSILTIMVDCYIVAPLRLQGCPSFQPSRHYVKVKTEIYKLVLPRQGFHYVNRRITL